MEAQKTIKKTPPSRPSAVQPAGTVKPKPGKTSGARKGRTGGSILTDDLIAERAWHIWNRRGRIPGTDKQNWFEAIDQLKEESDGD